MTTSTSRPTRATRPLALAPARLLAVVLALLVAGAGCSGGPPGGAGAGRALGPRPPGAFAAVVVRAVDGDTLIARRGRGPVVRVRLIGVDTPETVRPGSPVQCSGHRAARYTAALLAGRRVRAAYEPGGERDRYGRELWDVWLPDGSSVAALLVAGGYARAYPVRPQVRHAAALHRLEAGARRAGRGLWGAPCHGGR